MSADLLDLEDERGTSIILTMNVNNLLEITIMTACDVYTYFRLKPDEDGFAKAEQISEALKEWVAHARITK